MIWKQYISNVFQIYSSVTNVKIVNCCYFHHHHQYHSLQYLSLRLRQYCSIYYYIHGQHIHKILNMVFLTLSSCRLMSCNVKLKNKVIFISTIFYTRNTCDNFGFDRQFTQAIYQISFE